MLQSRVDPEQVADDNTHPSLPDICKKMIKIFDLLLSEQNTVQKKWKNYLSDKETFVLGGSEHQLKLSETLNYLKQMDTLQANLMNMKDPQAIETIFGILLRVGFLTKNIQLGKNVFLMQNYGAQRVKKLAHMQQAIKNVEIKKGQIALVKKQYKGKMEVMKQHKDTIQSFYEKNKKMDLDLYKPAELMLSDVIGKSKDTPLSYLKIEKLEDGKFKIGE